VLSTRTRNRIVIATLCVLYVAVRLWRLGDSCLWFDEVFSVHAAEHDWGSLLTFVAKDLIHPPLFYLILKLWIAVGGESIFWLRMLPVIFSVFAIFPFVRLCRELKLETSDIFLSLFLLAVNGALIKYTQTLRMYSMLMFLALVSMWLFARYFRRGKSFIPLVIANVLLIYTHYFGWLVIGTEVAAILLFQRIKWRRVVVMSVIAIASFVPWLIAIRDAARQGSDLAQNIAWQARPGVRELVTFAIDLVEPFYFQASSGEPASMFLVSIPLLLIFLAALIMYLADWKNDENKESVKLLLLFIAVPFVVAFVASWALPHSVWGTRHLIIILAPALAFASHALLSIQIREVRRVLTGLVIGMSCAAFLLNVRRESPRYVWCAWNDVAAEIMEKDPGSRSIYAFENLVAYHLWFALRDSDRFKVMVIKGVDVRTADETYFLPRGFEAVQTVRPDEISDDVIWLAFRTSEPGEYDRLMKIFEDRDYKECAVESGEGVRYDSTMVYSVKMSRKSEACR
jgi:hypothetical protein